MQADELRFLLDFDGWAAERVLATAEQLTIAEFTEAAGPGHVAPRGAILHSIGGMRSWREWLQGAPSTRRPTEADHQTLEAVSALWRAEHALLLAYVEGLAKPDFDEVLEQRRPDRVLRAERWQFVLHLILHHMQHRSELAQALTLLGRSPGELGLTSFLQHAGLSAPATDR